MLLELGLLSPEAVEKAVVSAWNPVCVGFRGSGDLWVDDVLSIGVDARCAQTYDSCEFSQMQRRLPRIHSKPFKTCTSGARRLRGLRRHVGGRYAHHRC